jgi:hypothetical protein
VLLLWAAFKVVHHPHAPGAKIGIWFVGGSSGAFPPVAASASNEFGFGAGAPPVSQALSGTSGFTLVKVASVTGPTALALTTSVAIEE